MKLTERRIQRSLFWKLHSACELIVPNYTPSAWFECDLWAVTKAGYGVEFEIKLTTADFRKDAEKRRSQQAWLSLGPKGMRFGDFTAKPEDLKHTMLEMCDIKGPSRFWYVAPEGVIPDGELPAWAGLKIVAPARMDHVSILTKVEAPRLHKEKVCRKIVEHARGVFYWRFWKELSRQREV